MRAKFDPALLPADPDLSFERHLWRQGLERVAGIDEAGRGPIAGPVAAAAVILPVDESAATTLFGVCDSKQMTAEQRTHWAGRIKAAALAYGIGFADVDEIDSLGILPAIYLAIERALAGLSLRPQHLLTDYLKLPRSKLPQTALVKGDARSLSIAAASVLAKTARDELLYRLDAQYPGYGFASHKGYCTRAHLRALESLGPCELHRRTFRPLRSESQPLWDDSQ